MKRIQTSTAVADKFGVGKPGFRDGDPSSGLVATDLEAAFFDQLQESVVRTIEDANIALSSGDMDQFVVALKTIIDRRIVAAATAGGTANNLTVTVSTVLTALVEGHPFTIVAAAANTNVVTATLTLGTTALPGGLPVVKGNNLPLSPGDIPAAGYPMQLNYSETFAALVLMNPATVVSGAAPAAVQGEFRALSGSATGSNAVATYAIGELVTSDGAGNFQTTRAWAGTIAMTTLGLGGLDVGAVAANTWYNFYGITKPDGTRGFIASISSTGPSFANAAGFTKWARIGAGRTDSTANKFLLGFKQSGRRVRYLIGSATNVTGVLPMASGVSGSVTTPTWTAVAVGAFAPPTAVGIAVALRTSNGIAMVAPNSAYGAASSNTSPPLLVNHSPNTPVLYTDMLLESTNIYYASDNSGGGLYAAGWEDSI